MNNVWAVVAVLLGAGPVAKDAGTPKDLWEFDDLTAKVVARGDPADELSKLALGQLGLQLEANAVFKVSAHANTVGGVTLRVEDPADPKVTCALYATREGDVLTFKDSRCSFPLFKDQLRTVATCRKISGTARRVKGAIAFEANAPDCTAQPMGMPLSVRATVKPL
jgi:hypothetical protein